MRVFRSTEAIQKFLQERRAVSGVTIGNFDGMHLGHQALFSRLTSELKKIGEPHVKVLFTFYPHPKDVLSGSSRAFYYLTPLRERIRLAEKDGFDCFFLLRFTPALSNLSPREFVERYLKRGLSAKLAVVGHDWAFGKAREGTPQLLCEYGEDYEFRAIVVPAVTLDGVRISSGVIREALGAGDLETVARYAGRNFSLTGRVIMGEQRGRTIGFPTANVYSPGQMLPANGVYLTLAGCGEHVWPSVTNIGMRPTFGGTSRLMETHIVDQPNLELYGHHISLEFIKRIRDEKRFGSPQELTEAIKNDVALARAFFLSRT